MRRTFSALVRAVLVAVLGSFGVPTSAFAQGVVYLVPVTGVVELGMAPFIERSLEEAASQNVTAVILDMDTPGGRVDAAERIADAISDADVPVYTLVNRRAFSAGALIALSSQHIYMRPGSVIGAATPVDGSGETAPEKIVSAMRSEMRALAEARGLDPSIAEAMVDPDVSVEGVDEVGKLLTLTTEEAVRVGYATEVEDLTALLDLLGVPGAQVVMSESNWAEGIVRFFSNPVVAPFLLTLGFLGLITEIKTAGFGLAGLAGILALSLFFGSHLIVGLAGWEDLIIFAVGVALLGLEIFLIPGFGFFGVLGVLGMVAGVYLSLMGSLPTSADFTRAGLVLSTTMLLIIVTAWAMIRTLPRSTRFLKSGIILGEAMDRSAGFVSAEARRELVGQVGRAITDLRPSGTGIFGDERIDVVSESEWITEGTPIRIISAEGYRHVVRPVLESPSA